MVSFGFSEAYGCKPIHDKPDNVLHSMTLLLHGGELVVKLVFCPMHTVFFYIYYIDFSQGYKCKPQ